MSEKRLLGWEPVETHELVYDDAGRHVRTVVTREAEWDDVQRDAMLGLQSYRDDLCRECGFPTMLHAPKYRFALEVNQCKIRAAQDRYDRMLRAADEKVGNVSPETPRASDGRQVTTRLKPPASA